MGTYTGIRFKGYIKPRFRKDFEKIALEGKWDESSDQLFRLFGRFHRASFIPLGALCYMPKEWETELKPSQTISFEGYLYEKHHAATDGFERSYDPKTGYWSFQCSLKNYQNEIEAWFKILPYFVEEIVHLEYYYEESSYSQLYTIKDDSLVMINNKYRKYCG